MLDTLVPIPFQRVGMQGTRASKAISYKYNVPYDTCQSQITDIWKDNQDKIDSFINSDSKDREKNLYFYFLDELKKLNNIKQVTTKDKSKWRWKSNVVASTKEVTDINYIREHLYTDLLSIHSEIVKLNIEYIDSKLNITIIGKVSNVFLDFELDEYEFYIYTYLSKYVKVTEHTSSINKRIVYSPFIEFELNRVDWNDEDIYEIYDRKEIFALNRHLFDLTEYEDLVIDMIFNGYNINNSPDDSIILEALKSAGCNINSLSYLKGAFMDRLIYKLKHNSPFRDDL
jgi:hypothetical protein